MNFYISVDPNDVFANDWDYLSHAVFRNMVLNSSVLIVVFAYHMIVVWSQILPGINWHFLQFLFLLVDEIYFVYLPLKHHMAMVIFFDIYLNHFSKMMEPFLGNGYDI